MMRKSRAKVFSGRVEMGCVAEQDLVLGKHAGIATECYNCTVSLQCDSFTRVKEEENAKCLPSRVMLKQGRGNVGLVEMNRH